MIHTKPDFFNVLSSEIRERYFNDVKYYRDDKNCSDAIYSIELFNNGCLTYRAFIGRLAKYCDSNNASIHNIVERHILTFGEYQYKPGRLYSQSKAQSIK